VRGTGYLVCRAGGMLSALPLEHVSETMRPLPLARVDGAPEFVAGAAIIRGVPTPVLDAARLLGGAAGMAEATRFVTVRLDSARLGRRHAALAVAEVLGVRQLGADVWSSLPPLLAGNAALDVVGALDAELLVVLQCARVVPDSLWSAVDAAGATA
jgi:purine-binding chemotaxis protein CheW